MPIERPMLFNGKMVRALYTFASFAVDEFTMRDILVVFNEFKKWESHNGSIVTHWAYISTELEQ